MNDRQMVMIDKRQIDKRQIKKGNLFMKENQLINVDRVIELENKSQFLKDGNKN